MEFREKLYKKYPKVNQKLKKGKKFNALILTDIHIQHDYLEGSATECDDPVGCCFEIDYFSKSKKAGYWGSKSNCDIPKRFFDRSIEYIQKNHINEFDYIFLLGDIYGHTFFRDKNS